MSPPACVITGIRGADTLPGWVRRPGEPEEAARLHITPPLPRLFISAVLERKLPPDPKRT